MTRKLPEGRSTALLLISSLTLPVGETTVKSLTAFPLSVQLEYWPFIKGDEETPAEPEFVELYKATLLSPLYLTNMEGVSASLDIRTDVLSLLSDTQYEALAEAAIQPTNYAAFDGKAVAL